MKSRTFGVNPFPFIHSWIFFTLCTGSPHDDSIRDIDDASSRSRTERDLTEGSASPEPDTSEPFDLRIFGNQTWLGNQTEQEPQINNPVKVVVIYIMLSILVS